MKRKHIETGLMLSIAIGLLLGLLLGGCTIKKSLTRSVDSTTTERTETSIHAVEFQQMDVKEAMRRITESRSLEDFTFTITIYDTSQLTDTATGTPPVSANITGSRKSSSDTKVEEEATKTDNSQSGAEIEADQSSVKDTDIRVREEAKTSKKPPLWVYFAVISALCWLAILVWYLKKRFF